MAGMMELLEIARLEEGRLGRALPEIADESRAVGGGVASRATPGSWLNYAVNVGMHGPVDRAEVEDVTRWYEAAGTEPRFEVCPYADGSLVEALAALGYVPRVFESVLFRELREREEYATVWPRPDGLEVRVLDPSDAAATRALLEVIVPAFFAEGIEPAESDYDVAARSVRHPRTLTVAAYMGDVCVGGGAMDLGEASAALFGLAVHTDYRRRGIQQALIAERLRIARERGARLATIGCRTGQEPSGTERNARRMGFQVAYTKVAVVRPGPGLKPAMG